jgi:hypothetical protein
MKTVVSIPGKIRNRQFIPDSPLPVVDGDAKLVVLSDIEAMIDEPLPSPEYTYGKPTHDELLKLLAEMAAMSTGKPLPCRYTRDDITEDDEGL